MRKASRSIPRLNVKSAFADALSRVFRRCTDKLLCVPVLELMDETTILLAGSAIAPYLAAGGFSLCNDEFTFGEALWSLFVELLGKWC